MENIKITEADIKERERAWRVELPKAYIDLSVERKWR